MTRARRTFDSWANGRSSAALGVPHRLAGGRRMARHFVVPAVLTFLAGFSAMNVFWALERSRTALRGLYSYLASSVGDALCLPMMVGGLNAARVSLPPAGFGPVAGLTGALLSFGGNLATQVAWLSDPHPDPNWTLPAPHTFNSAGWYHAAFSVCLAGYVGYLVGDIFARIRAHGVNRQSRRALIIATSVGAAFAILLVVDNLPNLDRSASRASMFLLGGTGAAMVALLFWAVRQRPAQ
jgi:hypothetical protein